MPLRWMLEYDNINHRIAKVTNSKSLLNYLTANQSFKFTLYQDFQTCKKIFSMSGDWAQSWTDYGAAYLGVNYDSRLHTFYLLCVSAIEKESFKGNKKYRPWANFNKFHKHILFQTILVSETFSKRRIFHFGKTLKKKRYLQLSSSEEQANANGRMNTW